MRILLHPALAATARLNPGDKALAEFRAELGAAALGRSDAELAAWKLLLDELARLAVEHALHHRAGVGSPS